MPARPNSSARDRSHAANVETATGIVTPLASKNPSLFSQYRRAEETPVFVSQVNVRLSRISSRVKLPTGLLSTNAWVTSA